MADETESIARSGYLIKSLRIVALLTISVLTLTSCSTAQESTVVQGDERVVEERQTEEELPRLKMNPMFVRQQKIQAIHI